MTGQNCDVLRYNVGASAAFLLAMAKVLRFVISEVRSGSNAKRFKSVATEISNIFCRDFAWGTLPDGTFCGQERNMLYYITALSVDIRMVCGMSKARHRIAMHVHSSLIG